MIVFWQVFTRTFQAICVGILLYLVFEAGSVSAQQPDAPHIQEKNEELDRRAKEVAEAFRRKNMVDLIDHMGTRVRGALGVIDNGQKGIFDNMNSVVIETDHVRRFQYRAILFASSSIPLTTLRTYAAQLEKINGVIVFRGVPGGISAIKPIVELTHKIILKNPDCAGQDCEVFDIGVILDPLIFGNNGVDRVPAITIVDHDPFAAYCERPQEEQAGSLGKFVTYGDAHLSGHLDELARQGDDRAAILLNVLNAPKEYQR